MSEHHNDRLLSHWQVLDRVGMGRTSLRLAVAAGRFPRPTRLGRRVFWSEREVAAWVARQLERRPAA
jgi:predicted DNA-binding transcriptional regulator AlpA